MIDYAISSSKSLKLLSDFKITEVDSLFSDGHALLSFYFDTEACYELELRQTNVKQQTKMG